MKRPPLAPLSWTYGAAVSARADLYRRGWLRAARVTAPVISVGNLAAGGTGKTPFVALVARILQEEGLRPAVVSRGYRGRRSRDPLLVSNGTGPIRGITALEAGDEPVMLARSLSGVPVIVSRRRSEGAEMAIRDHGARAIVLDDGFQHLALHRDLDLVLLDQRHPFGNGHLLPGGLLREPPAALARAHAIVLTGAVEGRGHPPPHLGAWVRESTPVFRARFEPESLVDMKGEVRTLDWIARRKTAAFAGISRPERLAASLENAGADLVSFLPFPDHHRYGRGDLGAILNAFRQGGAEVLVTTEKDLARLEGTESWGRLAGAGALALRGRVRLLDGAEGAFRELLVRRARSAEKREG